MDVVKSIITLLRSVIELTHQSADGVCAAGVVNDIEETGIIPHKTVVRLLRSLIQITNSGEEARTADFFCNYLDENAEDS